MFHLDSKRLLQRHSLWPLGAFLVGGIAVAFATARFGAISFAQAQPQPPVYTFTDLGVLSGDTESGAAGISERGEVVGWSGRTGARQRAVRWRNGRPQRLPTPEGFNSGATAVNDRGEAVGWFGHDGLTDSRAFLCRGKELWELGTLPGRDGAEASDVNADGEVVGLAFRGTTKGREEIRAVRWSGGAIRDMGVIPGQTGSAAQAIADSGVAVGLSLAEGSQVPLLFPAKKDGMPVQALQPLAGGKRSGATAVTSAGEVIGYSTSAGETAEHACLWQSGGQAPQDLGALSQSGSSHAQAINRHGQIIGWSEIAEGDKSGARHAFLYQQKRLYDLNTLATLKSGWELTEATGINDRGQIVGTALQGGRKHAFLLTPANTAVR